MSTFLDYYSLTPIPSIGCAGMDVRVLPTYTHYGQTVTIQPTLLL